jgi:hypothetical protein
MDMAGFSDSQLLSPEFGLAEFPYPPLQRVQLDHASLLKREEHEDFLYLHIDDI